MHPSRPTQERYCFVIEHHRAGPKVLHLQSLEAQQVTAELARIDARIDTRTDARIDAQINARIDTRIDAQIDTWIVAGLAQIYGAF